MVSARHGHGRYEFQRLPAIWNWILKLKVSEDHIEDRVVESEDVAAFRRKRVC